MIFSGNSRNHFLLLDQTEVRNYGVYGFYVEQRDNYFNPNASATSPMLSSSSQPKN